MALFVCPHRCNKVTAKEGNKIHLSRVIILCGLSIYDKKKR